MTPEPLVVIGVGPDGPASLSTVARDHIAGARVLAGGQRLLDLFPGWIGEKVVIDANLDRVIERLRDFYRRLKTVVLASGDPLFYGIGRRLLESFAKEDLVFIPQVSSVQMAFARLKETWNDARVVSVHGRPMENLLPPLHAGEAKIAVLTDPSHGPAAIAGLLEDQGYAGDYDLWVCENLGGAGERVRLWQAGDHDPNPLHLVVLLRKSPVYVSRPQDAAQEIEPLPLLGIPDHALTFPLSPRGERRLGEGRARCRGMFTRREIRVLTLTALELRPGDILWDIGAGSGSVSVEAARLSKRIKVFAVEKDPQVLPYLKENLQRFGLANIQAICGEAPACLTDLPDPDRVFIGGSGGRLGDILSAVAGRLKPAGRIVLNCIALETFNRAWNWLQDNGWQVEANSIQLAHSRPLGSLHSFEPENPVIIIGARKK